MATLTSSYQYIGRSNAVSCKSGYNYYILLYAKTSPNTTAGTHTVTVKQVLACTSDSTFHNWNTSGSVTVAGVSAISWSKAKVPETSWSGSASLTEGGVTYKRHTVLKEGSAVVNTGFGADKTVNVVSSWVMNDSSTANWFPYSGVYANATIAVTLSMIAGASTPTLSASSVQMGNTLTITTNRLSSNFTHSLYYTFGGTKVTMATGVGASYAWMVPDLTAKCNNATSGTCTITCDTYNGATKIGSKTVTVTLTVYDATTPTLSASIENAVNTGSVLTISTPRKGSNFTHKVTYKCDSATGTIAEGVTTSTSWTVPYSIAAILPDATRLRASVTCYTYNGTAQVGYKQVYFDIAVPDNATTKPTISNVTLSPIHSLSSTFSGLYVQGKTAVRSAVTASSAYSTISKYRQTVNGATKEGTSSTITSATLSKSGSLTVTNEVLDARGYGSRVDSEIYVIPYNKPAVVPYTGQSKIICRRSNADGTANRSGTNLYIAAGRSYSPVKSGSTQKNFCLLRYRYKLSTSSSFSSWQTLIAKNSTTTDYYSGVVSGVTLNVNSSYNFEIGVVDDLGGETEAVSIPADIPTAFSTFRLREGGDGASFGKYPERANAVDIADEWELYVHGMTIKEYIKAVINGTE